MGITVACHVAKASSSLATPAIFWALGLHRVVVSLAMRNTDRSVTGNVHHFLSGLGATQGCMKSRREQQSRA